MKNIKYQITEKLFPLLNILIFLTILLTPLYVIRWKWFGGLPTTLLETLILLTAAVWGIAKILRKDFSWPKTSFDKPILLFLLAGIISLFVTSDLRGGLGAFKAYIVEPILFFYILVDVANNWQPLNSKSKTKFTTYHLPLTIYCLLLSGLWISLLGIMQVVFGIGIVAPHEAAAGRAHAIYNTGNAVGLYLGPIFALTVGFFLQNFTNLWSKFSIFNFQFSIKNRRFQTIIVDCLLLIVMAVAIFFSKSTGALVGLAAIFAVFLLFRLFGVRQRRIWGLRAMRVIRVVGVIGALIGLWFFLNISRFTPEVENPWERPAADTLTPRLCLWEGTKNLLLERPILGAGLSGFKELYSQHYFTCDAEPLEYPHNWALNFWVELGLPGLIAFLWILWESYKRIRGLEIRESAGPKTNSLINQFTNPLRISLTAAMVYSLVHGLVDVPYFKNDLALEFWVIIAILEILGRRQSLSCQNQQ